MKIVVLMKQVVNKDAVLRIAPDEKWINETDVGSAAVMQREVPVEFVDKLKSEVRLL